MPPSEELDETQILAALLGISEMIGSLTDPEEVLGGIARIAPSLVRVNRCAILLYDEARGEFRTRIAFGPGDAERRFGSLLLQEGDLPRLAQRLVKQRLPVLVKDEAKDGILPADLVRRLGIRSALITPLVFRERVLGALWLDSSEASHYFTSKEINVVQGIATQAALALENDRLANEAELHRRRIAALAGALTDGVLAVDEDLRIVWMDGGAERLLGWTPSEILGRRMAEVFDIPEAHAAIAWTRDASGPSPAPREVALRGHDGVRVPCLLLPAVVRREGGEATHVLFALRRRSGARDAEERAMESLRQLEEPEGSPARPE